MEDVTQNRWKALWGALETDCRSPSNRQIHARIVQGMDRPIHRFAFFFGFARSTPGERPSDQRGAVGSSALWFQIFM
jgi:hypothetical protein